MKYLAQCSNTYKKSYKGLKSLDVSFRDKNDSVNSRDMLAGK